MNPFTYLASASGATGWFQIALFAAIVYVRIARPQMIRSPTLYRWGCTALVLSILVPVGLNLFLVFYSPEAMGMGARLGRNPYGIPALTQYGMLCSATGPIALSASLFCYFAALAPPIVHEFQSKPAERKPHPLD